MRLPKLLQRKKSWTDEELIDAVATNMSMADVLRALNLKITGANYSVIKRHVRRLELSKSHWTGQGHLKANMERVAGVEPAQGGHPCLLPVFRWAKHL